MKISGVNEQLGITESAGIAPRQEAVSDDVADEQDNHSASDPALHRPNEKEISHGNRCKTIRRECVNAKTWVALGKPGTVTKSRVSWQSTLNLFRNGDSLLANTFGVGFIDWLDEAGRTTGEALELDAALDKGGVAAVASQMNLYRCDR